jgi:PIN domain nuclease of toxin-antitoxin system
MWVLLNTHTFLWFVDGNPLLSPMARSILEDIAN